MFKGTRSRKKNSSSSTTISSSSPKKNYIRSKANNKLKLDINNSSQELKSIKNIPISIVTQDEEQVLVNNSVQNILDEDPILNQIKDILKTKKEINLMDLPSFKVQEDKDEIQSKIYNELNLTCKQDDSSITENGNNIICEGLLTKTIIDELNNYIPRKEITYISSKPISKQRITKNNINEIHIVSEGNNTIQHIEENDYQNNKKIISSNLSKVDLLYKNLVNIFKIG